MKSTLFTTTALALTLAGAHASEPAPGTAAKAEGTVTGRVVFEGERPEPKPLVIGDEQSKGCHADESPMDTTDQSLLVSEDGGIANAVITIEVEGMELEVPEEPVEIDQHGCRFEPHVVVVPKGGSVVFLNSDDVSHNIHTYATKNPSFNKTVSAGQKLPQKLDAAEEIKVTCDIHPWMSSYIFVTDAQKSTVTGEDGTFQVEGLPAGEYEVEVWHEKLGKVDGKVTVAEDGTSEPLEISLGEKKDKGGRRRR